MAGTNLPKPRLICIVGPTGVGKTGLALELAGRCGGEIVSADSMQVYRHMDIGTAKPTAEERARISHHLIDVADPDEPFDASRYIALANDVIARLHREGKPIFVVGGTGLYVRVLLGGLIDGPGADEELRRQLKEEMKRFGKEHLYGLLKAKDEKAAAQIHPNDGVRIIRALEVLELTGRSIVEHQQAHGFQEAPYEAVKIGLKMDRDKLNDRIDQRTDKMIADGFVEEVRRLRDMGYDPSLKPMQSLGYRHLVPYLAGRKSLEEAVGLIKRDTRLYSKRQMTWFAADKEIAWFDPEDVEGVAGQTDFFL
jgi:tRNA dimethylallyltransferase